MNTRIAKYFLIALIISVMLNVYLYKISSIEREIYRISFIDAYAKAIPTKQPPVLQSVESLLREHRTPQVAGNCGTNECFCGTNTEITNFFWADSYDANHFKICSAKGDDSPEKMFQTPGSQNIPVLAHTGLYLANQDPAWLTKYLSIQRVSSGKNIGFMGKELFSTTYGPPVASAMMLVHNQALKLGHSALSKETTGWLKTYWASYALGAVSSGISKTIVYTGGAAEVGEGTQEYFTGYVAPHVGTRSAGDGNTDSELNPMLSLALDIQPRSWTEKVMHNQNLHSLGKTAIAIGLPIDADARVNLGAFSFPAKKFGLTEEERTALREFISTNGTKQLDAVVAMLADYRPAMAITYYRTTNGVATWFGTSSADGQCVNPNKPGCVFATKIEGSVAEYLHPNDDVLHQPHGRSYRSGNKICAKVPSLDKQCLTLPTGTIVYEISWTPDKGIVRVR